MIARLVGLILTLWLGTAAAAEAGKVNDANITTQKAALAKLDKTIEHDESVWKNVIQTYVEQQILEQRLATVTQTLQNPEIMIDASAKKSLLREQKSLESQLLRIDPKKIDVVDYYLYPKKERLSIQTKMYREFEQKVSQLERLKSLWLQRQRLLQKLIAAASAQKSDEKLLVRTDRELDVAEKVLERIRLLSDARREALTQLKTSYGELREELNRSNIWQKSYTAYLTYMDVRQQLSNIDSEITQLRTEPDSDEKIDALSVKQRILKDQLSLLQTHGTSPFAELLKPEDITTLPEIGNPIDIFSGFSFIKRVDQQYKEYLKRGEDLRLYLQLLLKEKELILKLSDLDASESYTKKLTELDQMIEQYRQAYATMQDTADVYGKRIEEIDLKVSKAVQVQLYKLVNIGGIIVFLLVIFFIMKQIAKRYISDNERFYMANKVITFVNVSLILMVLLFNYIENVSYLVTVLGFASAGIAIAMKDWFMSMLGWLVIVFGGSIHVGDRVRVDKDGMKYVGDVLDISLLRITILEDITLTSYMVNRRAGRVIFIPNNYIFTHMIANYTHVSLKTVWDGIDITITFDSNHKKAAQIAKEITRKYAKGYTDITRQQLNKLRSRYNLKNTNVDPRIYTFVEENGIRISAWYLTNAYATLTLRSTISMEIIDSYGKEEDITIAYPTQRLRLQNEPLPQPKVLPEEPEELA